MPDAAPAESPQVARTQWVRRAPSATTMLHMVASSAASPSASPSSSLQASKSTRSLLHAAQATLTRSLLPVPVRHSPHCPNTEPYVATRRTRTDPSEFGDKTGACDVCWLVLARLSISADRTWWCFAAAVGQAFVHPRLVFHQPLGFGRLLTCRYSESEQALHADVDCLDETRSQSAAATRATGESSTSSRGHQAAAESPLIFDSSMESGNLLKAVQVWLFVCRLSARWLVAS